MEVEITAKSVLFKEVKSGETFLLYGKAYIKLEIVDQAVRLDTGSLHFVEKGACVIPINLKCTEV